MLRSLLLALLVLVTGCAGTLPPLEGPSTDTSASPATEPPTTAPLATTTPAASRPTTTSSPIPPRETATPAASDNPWGTREVVVAVENEAGYAHEEYDLFREALEFWTANAPRYAGYDVEFVLDPDAASPDVTIRYVESIDECGETPTTENTLGCAPLYLSGHVDDHTVVRIRENDDDVQLVETTKHEFGHVLGIAHGEEPMPLMAEDNLHLHASPWNRSAVRYTLDLSDGPGFSDEYLEDHVAPAFGYLEGGADGAFATPPGFERVDARSESNVVVELHGDARGEDAFEGSLVERSVEGSIDGHPYARYTLALYDLDPDATAWHVAYLLTGLLLEGDEARPESLDPDECGYQCRRDDWWT